MAGEAHGATSARGARAVDPDRQQPRTPTRATPSTRGAAAGARVRRRRGATFKPKQAPRQMNDELQDLPLTILRATYQNAKNIREPKGSIITTVRAEEKDPLAVAIETENKRYARAILQEGESHKSVPPPALGAAMAMVETLAKQDIGAKCRADLESSIQALNQMDEHQVADTFPLCKLEKTFESGQCKIPFTRRSQEIRQHIMNALHSGNRQACTGPAPARFVEDELALWMEAMMEEL
ncbi:unnamed protein product [Prorocentrum cordatum]|uniref:Uncharacterized protein n=1 Tax=Prorocentrum cordatum TaxID=2364126 RepID=A0ABN9YK47_9DINO|nr:unnamed protein product [Polarella glacialis]